MSISCTSCAFLLRLCIFHVKVGKELFSGAFVSSILVSSELLETLKTLLEMGMSLSVMLLLDSSIRCWIRNDKVQILINSPPGSPITKPKELLHFLRFLLKLLFMAQKTPSQSYILWHVSFVITILFGAFTGM